ncbi:MAG: LptF/LptG family permease [Geminicoccaceae bacterium]|nr:LptF/LptG family permease [Geminicoccaceae bacterium]
MSRLTRYLNRLYLVRFAVVLLAVAGFALLFDLLDVGAKVVRRSGGSSWALVSYALIRLPTLLTELLPMVALLAGLLTAADLLRFRELVAMWSAGLSRLGLAVRLWPAALLIVAGKLVLDDVAVPATIPTLRALGVADVKTVGLPTGDAIWLTTDGAVLRLPAEAAVQGEPRDLLILRLDPEGRLVERLEAARAEPGPEGWILHEVVRRPASAAPSERLDTLLLPMRIDLETVALMAKLPRELSIAQLLRVIGADGYGIGGTESHRTWLHARLAGAVGLWALIVVPVLLVRRAERTGTTLAIFTRGLAIGFAYLIGNGLMLAMGELGLAPPAVAAWTVPFLLAAGALSGGGLLEPRRGRPVAAPPPPSATLRTAP